jgi:hypothetical protein
MKLRSGLSIVPLDDDSVVFCEEAQTLVGLNATAAAIVESLAAGGSAAEVAARLAKDGVPREIALRWIRATVDDLAAHGMAEDGGVAAIPASRPGSAGPTSAPRLPPRPAFTPAATRFYSLLGTVFRVRYGDAAQVSWVDAAIGHLAVAAVGHGVAIDVAQVAYREGRPHHHVYLDSRPAGFATQLDRLGPVVKALVWQTAINRHDYFVYLHAGVVATDRSLVLLPAAAGSGKSSLTAALSRSGFGYFSDEVALVEPGTFLVPPVPLALCVKSTGFDVVRDHYPAVLSVPTHQRSDGKFVRYLPPPLDAALAHPAGLPVSHIVFPEYRAGASTELARVPRVAALQRMMDECLALSRRLDRANVDGLVRWVGTLDCYALRYSSLAEAVAKIKAAIRLECN